MRAYLTSGFSSSDGMTLHYVSLRGGTDSTNGDVKNTEIRFTNLFH